MKKRMLTVSSWLLTTLVGFLGFTACLPWEGPRMMYGTPYATYSIKGKVVNNINEPIPAIQIVIDGDNGRPGSINQVIVATDAKGEFAKVYSFTQPLDTEFTLKLEDIDGMVNGLYKSSSQKVSIKKSELNGGSGWNSGSVQKDITVTLEKDVK